MKTIKELKSQIKSEKEMSQSNKDWGTRWMNYATETGKKK